MNRIIALFLVVCLTFCSGCAYTIHFSEKESFQNFQRYYEELEEVFDRYGYPFNPLSQECIPEESKDSICDSYLTFEVEPTIRLDISLYNYHGKECFILEYLSHAYPDTGETPPEPLDRNFFRDIANVLSHKKLTEEFFQEFMETDRYAVSELNFLECKYWSGPFFDDYVLSYYLNQIEERLFYGGYTNQKRR